MIAVQSPSVAKGIMRIFLLRDMLNRIQRATVDERLPQDRITQNELVKNVVGNSSGVRPRLQWGLEKLDGRDQLSNSGLVYENACGFFGDILGDC